MYTMNEKFCILHEAAGAEFTGRACKQKPYALNKTNPILKTLYVKKVQEI